MSSWQQRPAGSQWYSDSSEATPTDIDRHTCEKTGCYIIIRQICTNLPQDTLKEHLNCVLVSSLGDSLSLSSLTAVVLLLCCAAIFCRALSCWAGPLMLISLCLTSILNPGGRKVLKPTMRSGWPRNKLDTLLMTPGVSILRRGEGGWQRQKERRDDN